MTAILYIRSRLDKTPRFFVRSIRLNIGHNRYFSLLLCFFSSIPSSVSLVQSNTVYLPPLLTHPFLPFSPLNCFFFFFLNTLSSECIAPSPLGSSKLFRHSQCVNVNDGGNTIYRTNLIEILQPHPSLII